MISVHVTCNTGKNWSTQFNGTFSDAENYFLNKVFTDEDDDGKETHNKCTNVRLESPRAPLATFSPEWFDYTFEDAVGITPELRLMSERMCREFNICGIYDPMHIANVAASELGIGDGRGNFTGASIAVNGAIIDKLAKRFAFAYSSCIADKISMLRPLLTETLGLPQ